ncbi:MAG: cysteine desulfurase-like protein [Solirubrobacterales bacterium]|nr:cysteine desulfurase-like protein [Solirubrobacterales bacterium]
MSAAATGSRHRRGSSRTRWPTSCQAQRAAHELDIDEIRARFPALERRVGGRTVAYFDGPGGSQAPRAVIDAVAGYLERSNANAGGAFASSRETDELLAAAHGAAADLVGAKPGEIAFGANMTTLNFLLSHAVARTCAPGDEIVVTQLDHDANVSPWFRAAEDRDLVVRVAPIRAGDGTLDHDALEALIGERTRVVAFTLASNALGNVPDARRLAAAAHRVGALAWADGVHLAPHRRIDRDALGLDVVLCSPYKFFGPHLGLAAIRSELAERLPADRVRAASSEPPGHRFEAGTLNHEALAGTVAAIDYLAGLASGGGGGTDADEGAEPDTHGSRRRARLDSAYEAIRVHEESLAGRFLEQIPAISGLRLHGLADPGAVAERTPTFLIEIEGHPPREVAAALGRRGMFAWDGDFYAPAPLRLLGLGPEGGVRIGFLHYNAAAEVDALLEALAEIAAGRDAELAVAG